MADLEKQKDDAEKLKGGISPEAQAAIDKRISELVEARKAAEAKVEASERAREAERARFEKTIEERLPKAPEPEPVWTDPGEEALKETRALRAELARRDTEAKKHREDEAERSSVSAGIDRAIATYKFEDEEEARETLARNFFASKHLGIGYDPDAEAKKLVERQQARVTKKSEEAKAEEKRLQAAATASAMAGSTGVSLGVPRSDEVPKWGTPERKAWEAREAAQFGFKSGLAR